MINVGGNRIGTEEIESALLADTERAEGSPLQNCAVVGMPDEILGTVPVAFIVPQPGAALSGDDAGRLRALVEQRIGSVAVPSKFVMAAALPETYSGKFMRALLKKLLVDSPLGDLGALRNPECVEPLQHAVREAMRPAEPEQDEWAQALTPPTRAAAEAAVMRIVRELTGAPAASLTAETPLMEAGVNSLAATRLATQLRAHTGVALSPTLVFQFPTPRAIVSHLLDISSSSSHPSSGWSMSAGRRVIDRGAPPALMGMAGSYPGSCVTEASRAQLQAACGDAMSGVPRTRWDLNGAVDSARLTSTQVACVRHGGFIATVDRFDAPAFGLSTAEASAMDPQQRLLLECGYASLHGSSQRRATCWPATAACTSVSSAPTGRSHSRHWHAARSTL